MKLRPASVCCGCLSLVIGVELICFSNLLVNLLAVMVASSVEELEVGGITISPEAQVFNAAWALAGFPFIVCAGVGVLYRVESHVYYYFYYCCGTFWLNLFWWLSILIEGSVCNSLVAKDVQRMGSAFVCGFTDAFVAAWMCIAVGTTGYCTYIIWSAAQEIGRAEYPDLMKYSTTLVGSMLPFGKGENYVENQGKALKEEKATQKPTLSGMMSNKPQPRYGTISTTSALQPAPAYQTMAAPVAPAYQTMAAPVGAPVMASIQSPSYISQSMGPPVSVQSMGAPVSVQSMGMGTPQSFIPSPAMQSGYTQSIGTPQSFIPSPMSQITS